MTVEDILKSLEEVRDKLNAIRQSNTYQALVAHEEYTSQEVTLTDSVQGIEETLEMIRYVSELKE